MNTRQNIIQWIAATLRESGWAPLGVVAFYLIGLAFGWFDLYPPLDMPTHVMGGAAVTYFFRSAIRNSQKFIGDIPPLVQILFGFTCTGTTAVLWEFYENAFDFLFGTHMVRGLEDTIMDLLMGLLGALALTLLYRRG